MTLEKSGDSRFLLQRKRTVERLQERPAYCLEGPAEQYLDVARERTQLWANVLAALSLAWRCGRLLRPRLVLSLLTQRSQKEGCNWDKLSYGCSELQNFTAVICICLSLRKKTAKLFALNHLVWALCKVRPLMTNIWRYKCKKNLHGEFGYGQKVKDVWVGQGQNSYKDKPKNNNNKIQ